MARHVLSDKDVDGIFASPFVISLASCSRTNNGLKSKPTYKALEYHLNLKEPFYSHYLVTFTTHDGLDTVSYKGGYQNKAVAEYNKIDV